MEALSGKQELQLNDRNVASEATTAKRAGRRKGAILSEETKQKIRMAKLGKTSPRKGAILSEETKQKMRMAKLGKKRSTGAVVGEATTAKRGGHRKGVILSEETKEKMRMAKLGKQHSILTRAKMAQSHTGRTVSAETRLKMSQAQKKRWSLKRQTKEEPATRSPLQVLEWEQEELSREAMVVELVKLRREVGHIVRELSQQGQLPETAEETGLPPDVHGKLWRYVWLLDQVRSSSVM